MRIIARYIPLGACLALGFSFVAFSAPVSGKSGLTVKVLDRENRPIPSSISFMVNGLWVEVGETNKRGVLVHPNRCGETVSVRAAPLDRNYFIPSPRLCATSLTFKVRRRSDPVVAYFNEYDSDKNGRLDRTEFANLAAATSIIDRQLPIARFTFALSTTAGQSERIEGSYALAYQLVQPLSGPTDLSRETTAAINASRAKGLLGAFAIDQPTVRAAPEYQEALKRYLNAVTAAPANSNALGVDRVLDITAFEFESLDKNRDGWLSKKEVKAAR